MTASMTLTLPENALRALGENAEGKVRLWAAVKGYELDELSADEAAELAGLSKVAFLAALGQFGVSVVETTEEELERDLEVARRARSR
jgi:predicted HTH domain antitoxin